MTRRRPFAAALLSVIALALACSAPLHAQSTTDPYQPKVGQSGKDTPWVPTPAEMVEKMLDLARVTSRDFVVDLGSGDGRNVIAAAKRGARALGVEYNPDLVEYSKRVAEREGVADKATFVQGDMFEADFSQATVLALFLLPDNLRKLQSKILALKPGSRVVANTFGFSGWNAESSTRMEEGCTSWCEAMLYIVPAHVDGSWRLPQGTLELHQEFQNVMGTLTANGQTVSVDSGTVRTDEITFTAGGATYTGRVKGDRIEGTVKSGERETKFTARRGK
jgi:SAM-dependent methyltransferase